NPRHTPSLTLSLHDALPIFAVAGERADEVLVMQSGSVVEAGEAECVFSHPATEYTSRLLTDAPALQTKPRRCLAEAAADSQPPLDRKSTRLNSSHVSIPYAV